MSNKYNQKKQSEQGLNLLGKVIPQAIDVEEAVLGALMTETKSFHRIEGKLSKEDFYLPKHQLIFEAMNNLSLRNEPIDILTIAEEIKKMGEIDTVSPVEIVNLSSRVASSVHLEYHCSILNEKSLKRKLISVTSDIQNQSFDESIGASETLENLEKSFTDLNNKSSGYESIGINEAIQLAINKANQAQVDHQSGKITAIPTHLNALDRAFEGGWRSPDLIILGGRPSMGKTQNSLAIAMAAANAGQDCLFVSIEMTSIQLVNRLLLESDNISSYNLRTGQMRADEWQALDDRIGVLTNKALHIADNHNIRYLSNIKTEARRLHRKGQLKLLIIDYLQLIKTNMRFERRQLEVAHITGELKALAKELEIPIIALSQLSRPAKGMAVKEPDLEDLREAGDIEQDADIVVFIHKPDYYNPSLSEWKNKGMLLIRKSREGVRNEGVMFEHDDRYKKIFDCNNTPSSSQSDVPF